MRAWNVRGRRAWAARERASAQTATRSPSAPRRAPHWPGASIRGGLAVARRTAASSGRASTRLVADRRGVGGARRRRQRSAWPTRPCDRRRRKKKSSLARSAAAPFYVWVLAQARAVMEVGGRARRLRTRGQQRRRLRLQQQGERSCWAFLALGRALATGTEWAGFLNGRHHHHHQFERKRNANVLASGHWVLGSDDAATNANQGQSTASLFFLPGFPWDLTQTREKSAPRGAHAMWVAPRSGGDF